MCDIIIPLGIPKLCGTIDTIRCWNKETVGPNYDTIQKLKDLLVKDGISPDFYKCLFK